MNCPVCKRPGGHDWCPGCGKKVEMKCYMVMGSTGKYSDRREWAVRAFLSESLAQDFIKLCDAEAKRIEVELRAINDGRVWYSISDTGERAKTNKYDPGMHLDYTGIYYYIEQAELDENR